MGVRATRAWARLAPLPGGKFVFSKLLGHLIPYTGSMGARVDHLEPGHAVVLLKERRRVRNHLNSVHAIALANLGEVTTGLATLSGMPENTRGILTGLELKYHKKARGLLRAVCDCDIESVQIETELHIEANIYDSANDCVATARASWLVGPIPGT